MDGWGIGIFVVSALLYFFSKTKPKAFLFTAGIGAGIVIGAIWISIIMNTAFGSIFP